MAIGKNWTTVTEPSFPWERDALDFVHGQFPNHEPHRAWSNFEFIADDGSINEVDLLVLTKMGIFLIEIKSRLERLPAMPAHGHGSMRASDSPTTTRFSWPIASAKS